MDVLSLLLNADVTRFLYQLCLCSVVALCTSLTCTAQQRGADSLFTTAKDTLVVKIAEVDIRDIKYKTLSGDTTVVHLIAKTKVKKVVYGNGETEEFKSHPSLNYYPSMEERSNQRYAWVASHPFQREITGWPVEKLLDQQKRYREQAATTTPLGVITAIVGPTLFVTGISKLFDSDAAGYFVSGVCVTSFTIPLAITGGKARKKVNFIKMELERRKNDGY